MIVKNDLAKLQLTSLVCTSKGEKIALSRRVEKHWRLIWWGQIQAGITLKVPPTPILSSRQTWKRRDSTKAPFFKKRERWIYICGKVDNFWEPFLWRKNLDCQFLFVFALWFVCCFLYCQPIFKVVSNVDCV
jgi:hypothetical protein